jgi:hypothetical protein
MHARKRYRWWLPLLMLALAALACDSPQYDPLRVQAVRADPDVPGHAFALVDNAEAAASTYETDDYGQTWRYSEQAFSDDDDPNAVRLEMHDDETLMLDGRSLWKFPRQTFRFFFLDDEYGQYFALPVYGWVWGSAAGDTLYVPMGTEGVLVGPLPGTGSTRAWTLTSSGITALNPLSLTITDPATVALIVILALVIPPLALIHTYLLGRAWVYLLPPQMARRTALNTALALAGLAAVAVVIWLTNSATTYAGIVAAMTLIVVVVGVGMTHRLAKQQDVDDKTRHRLMIAAGLVSLVVPAGVAAIWWLWWAVFMLVFGFAALQWMLVGRLLRPLPEAPTRRQRWLVDRLALETLAIGVILLVLFGLMVVSPLSRSALMLMGGIAGLVVLVSWALNGYIVWRLGHLLNRLPHEEDISFQGMTIAVLFMWVVTTGGTSFAIFYLQMVAYGWFASLLKT